MRSRMHIWHIVPKTIGQRIGSHRNVESWMWIAIREQSYQQQSPRPVVRHGEIRMQLYILHCFRHSSNPLEISW